MWQVPTFFVLGAVLTLAGAYAAHSLATSAESASGDAGTFASRFWWGVAAMSVIYALSCLGLAWLREDDKGDPDGKDATGKDDAPAK